MLIVTKTSHCVGYGAFFTTTCNFLLKKYNLGGKWRAKSQKGQIYFLGINVHNYSNSSFFIDHDFVITENNQTSELCAVDPTSMIIFLLILFTLINEQLELVKNKIHNVRMVDHLNDLVLL